MRRHVQSPTGAGFYMSKKMCLSLWLILTGIIGETNFASAIIENSNTSDNPFGNPTGGPLKNQSTSIESTASSTDYQNEASLKVQRAVPAQIKTLQFNDDDYREFLHDEALGHVRKVPLYLLKMYFYNKSQLDRRQGRPQLYDVSNENSLMQDTQDPSNVQKRSSIIPTPRFGRQDNQDSLQESFSSNANENTKRDGPSKSVIPYPRLGRDYEDMEDEEDHDSMMLSDDSFSETQGDRAQGAANSNTRVKRETTEYVLPQIRYGRSMVLLTTTKTDKSAKEKPTNFVLPYPRPGKRAEYSDVMLPYPRPGRTSDSYPYEELMEFLDEKKRQTYMIPSARLGRSNMDGGFEDEVFADDRFLGLKVNPLLLKNRQDKSNDGENNLNFMIPYPRPGKKSETKILSSSNNPISKTTEYKNLADYVLPYPRPGKKSYKMNSKGKSISDKDSNNVLEKFMLPYPRPGRSVVDWFESENSGFEENSDKDNFDNDSLKFGTDDHIYSNDHDYEEGEDFSVFRSKRSNSVLPYPRPGRSNSVLPYPRLGRSNSVVPYPRLGRSNSVVPYPRPGRSNSVVPYPILGRSNSVVPYPRLGRSNSVVPYPRPGRSNSVVPYPRLGRSNSVVPYPRPGRSNSVVPYPRLGRSNSVVPYPRPGRSNSVVPYPRLGRSNSVVPYPRLGRSNSVVPYPRPGRSDSVVPYPRLGRSNSVVPYPRLGKSLSVVQYPRPGQSDYMDLYSSSGISSYDGAPESVLKQRRSNYYAVQTKESLDNDKPLKLIVKSDRLNPIFLLPNMRPGRSPGEADNYVVPYPRPGRSFNDGKGYVLPHPRIGRSDGTPSENETTYGNTVIPYPRLGRSEKLVAPFPESLSTVHKLNKHMLSRTDDSVYLLPYPRPGR